MTEKNAHPDHEVSAPPIYGSVWRKTVTRNGRQEVDYSVRLQKRYKNEVTGQWCSTSYLRLFDLPKVILVASRIFESIVLREPAQRGSHEAGDAQTRQSPKPLAPEARSP